MPSMPPSPIQPIPSIASRMYSAARSSIGDVAHALANPGEQLSAKTRTTAELVGTTIAGIVPVVGGLANAALSMRLSGSNRLTGGWTFTGITQMVAPLVVPCVMDGQSSTSSWLLLMGAIATTAGVRGIVDSYNRLQVL